MNDRLWTSAVRWAICLVVGFAIVTCHYFWADYIGDKREAEVRAEFQTVSKPCDTKGKP